MKKRGKTIRKSSLDTRKKISIPILLFVLALVFVVYSGIMGLLNKAITTSNNEILDSGNLASYSGPDSIVFAGVVIVIFFIAVVIFLNIKVKKKKKRR